MNDIFFSDDLHNRLAGLADVARHLPESEFKHGFFACLNAIRYSFGMLPMALVIPYRKEVIYERQIDAERAGA